MTQKGMHVRPRHRLQQWHFLERTSPLLSFSYRRFSDAFPNGRITEVTSAQECVRTVFSRQSTDRPSSTSNWRSQRTAHVWFLLLLFVSTGSATTAKAAATQNGPTISSGAGLTIAIADFDGDRRPDLASVQPGRNESGSSTYWIQLQFSASGQQSVQLVAPAGGLGIEARDVNGDHAVDLIFTTAWLRKPVAILLNDGHGTFSRVEPAAFPAAFDEPGTIWACGIHLGADLVALPAQSRIGIDHANEFPLHHRSSAGTILLRTPEFPVAPALFFSAGRAPPSAPTQL